MKRIPAGLLFLPLCAFAQSAVYVDETSNYGNMTYFAKVSPFSVIDGFALPDISGFTLGTTTLTVSGQNGRGACSGRGCAAPTYRTTFDPPQLYTAQTYPGTSAQQTDVAPALDAYGQPVVFVCISAVKSPCTAWSWSGELPYGAYNLHLTGTSCGGLNCRIAGDSYIFVHSSPQYSSPTSTPTNN